LISKGGKEMAKEKKIKTKKENTEIFEEGKDKKTLTQRIINITLWVILLAWMAICTTDFILVQLEKKTIFTFSNQRIDYEDGHVLKRTGLGYRVFYYNRDSYKGLDFGPFWLANASEKNDEDNAE